MKKFLAVIILVFVFIFTGCGESGGVVNGLTNSMFVTVETGWNYKVMYCKDTKVMYVMSWGNDNQGEFTLLVNADGSPMLYKESED